MTSFDPNNPSFSHERYAALVEETITQINLLSKLKGGEYAGDEDRLLNFRRNGAKLGLPMEVVWHTYVNKHIDALEQYIKDILAGKTRDRLEKLEARCDDIIVYMILFKAMIEERRILGGPETAFKPFTGKTMPHHTEE